MGAHMGAPLLDVSGGLCYNLTGDIMIAVSLIDIDKKNQHSHAHRLLRECLKKRNVEYSSSELIAKGEYGKPYLKESPQIKFNLSHADGIAACIVSDRECGIDCERVRAYRPNVMKRAFSPKEAELVEASEQSERDLMFFRLWTLKEAYVKTLGTGISYPLNTAEFLFEDNRIITDIAGYKFRQYIIGGGEYVVSVCEKLSETL